MDEWKQRHAILAPIGICITTYTLWISLGLSLEEALNSSIIPMATLFYFSFMSVFDGVPTMFYFLHLMGRHKQEKAQLLKPESTEKVGIKGVLKA